MEQIRYNLLYRWFIGPAIDDGVWDHSVFSKNRDRLLGHAVAERFFTEVMQLADKRQLLSKEHFSVAMTRTRARPIPMLGSSRRARALLPSWPSRGTC